MKKGIYIIIKLYNLLILNQFDTKKKIEKRSALLLTNVMVLVMVLVKNSIFCAGFLELVSV